MAEKDIRGAASGNRDGFGLMYYNKELDTIVAQKACMKNINKILTIFDSLTPYEVMYHFRIRTHGVVSDSMCHPFEVTTKKKHGMDIWFMHNGFIGKQKGLVTESDTCCFRNNYLTPLLKDNPDFIRTEAFKGLIEEYIGGHNKVCFMFGKGETLRLNESVWWDHDGMRVSNKACFPYEYTAQSNYHRQRWDEETGGWVSPDIKQDAQERLAIFRKNKTSREASCSLRGERSSSFISGFKLCGVPVELGNTMFITHRSDKDWYAEGRITGMNVWSINIKFTDMLGVERNLNFLTSDGESVAADPGYQAILMSRTSPDMDKTIEGIEADLKKTITQEQLELDRAEEASLAEKGAEVIADEDAHMPSWLLPKPALQLEDLKGVKKKEETHLVSTREASCSLQVERSSSLDSGKDQTTSKAVRNMQNYPKELVSNGSHVVDAALRWFDCLENSLEQYNDGQTILDVENMDTQARFKFFCENKETAFAMFQDLVEKIVQEDIEDGIVDDGNELCSTRSEQEASRSDSDKKSMSMEDADDAERLDTMMMCAGSYC
jgi:hypothetical protein